jgi:hypothetical protein
LWSHIKIEQIAFVLAVAALIDVFFDPVGRRLAAAGVVFERSSPRAREREKAARRLRTAAHLAEHEAPDLAAHLHRRADVRTDLVVSRYPTRSVTQENALIYALAGALEVLPGGPHARYRLVAEIATQWTTRSVGCSNHPGRIPGSLRIH